MRSHIYFCAAPKEWGIDTDGDSQLFGHSKATVEGFSVYWPNEISAECVTPANIEALFTNIPKTIIVLDRIKNHTGLLPIGDHINKSGQNFLIGKTPTESNVRFPDISQMYESSSISVHPKTVITVGPERFAGYPEEKQTISEAAALIVPVLHYAGMFCKTFGASPEVKQSDILSLAE